MSGGRVAARFAAAAIVGVVAARVINHANQRESEPAATPDYPVNPWYEPGLKTQESSDSNRPSARLVWGNVIT